MPMLRSSYALYINIVGVVGQMLCQRLRSSNWHRNRSFLSHHLACNYQIRSFQALLKPHTRRGRSCIMWWASFSSSLVPSSIAIVHYQFLPNMELRSLYCFDQTFTALVYSCMPHISLFLHPGIGLRKRNRSKRSFLPSTSIPLPPTSPTSCPPNPHNLPFDPSKYSHEHL